MTQSVKTGNRHLHRGGSSVPQSESNTAIARKEDHQARPLDVPLYTDWAEADAAYKRYHIRCCDQRDWRLWYRQGYTLKVYCHHAPKGFCPQAKAAGKCVKAKKMTAGIRGVSSPFSQP